MLDITDLEVDIVWNIHWCTSYMGIQISYRQGAFRLGPHWRDKLLARNVTAFILRSHVAAILRLAVRKLRDYFLIQVRGEKNTKTVLSMFKLHNEPRTCNRSWQVGVFCMCFVNKVLLPLTSCVFSSVVNDAQSTDCTALDDSPLGPLGARFTFFSIVCIEKKYMVRQKYQIKSQ